jgi:hypothetical protein
MGAKALEDFYYAHPGEFLLHIRLPSGASSIHEVVFEEFSKSVPKRGIYEFWDIDLSVVEV